MGATVISTLWLAAAVAALAYWAGFAAKEAPGQAGAAVKTASTGFLALTLWADGPWPVALGLTLGAAGDWFLAQRGERAFLAGMAAFAAGHLAYVFGFLTRAAESGFAGADPVRLVLAALLLGLVASTEIWLAPRTGALRWPVRLYVLVIGAMGLCRATPLIEIFQPVNVDRMSARAGWQLQGAQFRRTILFEDLGLQGRDKDSHRRREEVSRRHPELFALPSSIEANRSVRKEFNHIAPDSVYQYAKVPELTMGGLIAAAQEVKRSVDIFASATPASRQS